MDPRIEAALDEWRFRSCDPGYAGLHALADAGFTGGVTTGDAVGFMVNGRLVGLTGGTTEAFWGSEFTALEAEGPALPLLCAMLSTNGTEEGEYYTGETPISDVDETLSDGGFTGYLELSENVFSGDYFVTYYGGRSFAVAFLGTEDRIATGEEARERANEEVGIYTVNSVEIDVTEIPDPDVDDSAGGVTEETEEPAPSPEPDTDPEPASQEVETPPEPSSQGSNAATQQTTAEREERSEVAELAESALGTDPGTIGDGQTEAEETSGWLAIPALDPDRTGSLDPPQESTPSEPEPPEEPTEEPEEPVETGAGQADLEDALEEARAENERLRERIEELEATIAELEAEESTQDTALSAHEALDGTNLFVRYETQSNFTLADAIEGSAERDDVANNLRLEWHTTFDVDDVTVDDEPFPAFLQSTSFYRFSEWLMAELLFELVESGEAPGFGDLLEILPEIDRIEFGGDIPVHRREDGERDSSTYTFDLVFRNSMGDPVMLAEIHEGRDPVSGEALDTLLAETNEVAKERQKVAGAFYVSQSYFEPPALETVAEATGGGFLRGSSRTSYVSVSRKRGFHLCLVEARNDSFHLNVPGD